jgi:hypothetical protein
MDHILGKPCLSNLQVRYLDLEGNDDGTFNLGDFLAELARSKAGENPIAGPEKPSGVGSEGESGGGP